MARPPDVIDIEDEIKCPPEKMYDLLKNNLIQLPHIFPGVCKSVEILEGDGKSLGTVRLWTYVMEDKPDEILVAKEKLIEVDDVNKSLTISVIEGDLAKTHKRFDVKITVTPKDNGSLVKWHIIFEKIKEDHPHPHHYLDIMSNISKKFDGYFHKE